MPAPSASKALPFSLYLTGSPEAEKEVKVKSFSCVPLFVNLWTVACQAPPSMGFFQARILSGLPFPSPGDLPDPGMELGSPTLQADSLPSEPQEDPSVPLSWEQTRGEESWVSRIDCRKLGAHLGGEEGWGPGLGSAGAGNWEPCLVLTEPPVLVSTPDLSIRVWPEEEATRTDGQGQDGWHHQRGCPSAPASRGSSLQVRSPELHYSHEKTPTWEHLCLGGLGRASFLFHRHGCTCVRDPQHTASSELVCHLCGGIS